MRYAPVSGNHPGTPSRHTNMTTSALHNALFSDVAGYSLSATGKAVIGRESDPALTYGECTPEAVEHILAVTGAKPDEVFYDLGSGTGKMVVFAAFFLPLKKSVGIELLSEIRTAPNASDTAVILLSTEAEVKDRVRGMRTGADEYVGKPYEASYLIARARALLSLSCFRAGRVHVRPTFVKSWRAATSWRERRSRRR